jgi:hypothetical protein
MVLSCQALKPAPSELAPQTKRLASGRRSQQESPLRQVRQATSAKDLALPAGKANTIASHVRNTSTAKTLRGRSPGIHNN